jgi:hypothetical protein
VYSQASGLLSYVNNVTGSNTPIAFGYSGNGYGQGLNNPGMQSFTDVGPIPQGTYTIGPLLPTYTTSTGAVLYDIMTLTPAGLDLTSPLTIMFNRTGFLFHGSSDYSTMDSSKGCIVLRPNIRKLIARSGDTILRVVP